MSSKLPTETPLREIALQLGDNERVQAGFDLGGPLTANSRLRYRLTGLRRSAETDVRFQKNDRYFLAPAFSWGATERTDVTFLASWQSDPSLTVFQYLPRVGTVEASPHADISARHVYG